MISKQTSKVNYSDIIAGSVFLIDKAKGKTSFDIVRNVRKKANIRKVGHAGTLDPEATGLLIVCTGKKTKEISKFQDMPKVYTGSMTLGKRTPSMDNETDPVDVKSTEGISLEDIERVRSLFIGVIQQVPPMYSAIKHKGKALYKYARKGLDVERKPREVTIYDFKITKIDMPNVSFEIKCSKGTYIRVIANDFGEKLNCGGYLSELRRTQIGDFKVDEALTDGELVKLEVINDNLV